MVFLDETGIILGLARTHARSKKGTRVYEMKPFYHGAKVTVIGAISIKKVVALMTMDNSMDGKAFEVFIKNFLVPQLWPGAVVVMDNLPAHKLASIEPMIESVGRKLFVYLHTHLILIPLSYGGPNSNLFYALFLQLQHKWLIKSSLSLLT